MMLCTKSPISQRNIKSSTSNSSSMADFACTPPLLLYLTIFLILLFSSIKQHFHLFPFSHHRLSFQENTDELPSIHSFPVPVEFASRGSNNNGSNVSTHNDTTV